jgi:hypothetical protein
LGLLFWILLLFAVAWACYFFLTHPDGDRELAVAGVLTFTIMCAIATELFGWLLQDLTKGDTHESRGANFPAQDVSGLRQEPRARS